MSTDVCAPLPTILPAGWGIVIRSADGYMARNGRYTVIVSDAVHGERRWRHFSMSAAQRIPTWDEFIRAKEIFLGTESRAIQVIPPRSEYVNINPNVLHLFVCMDGDVLPDFTEGSHSL